MTVLKIHMLKVIRNLLLVVCKVFIHKPVPFCCVMIAWYKHVCRYVWVVTYIYTYIHTPHWDMWLGWGAGNRKEAGSM